MAYLARSGKLPQEKFISSSGMGESMEHDADATTDSKAQARRVTVFILVSKMAQKRAQ